MSPVSARRVDQVFNYFTLILTCGIRQLSILVLHNLAIVQSGKCCVSGPLDARPNVKSMIKDQVTILYVIKAVLKFSSI